MSIDAFLAARDFLFRTREDYQTAYRDFRWPKLDRFNWALDHFDRMAEGNERPALWQVDDEATSRLMMSFYAGLKSMDKRDALRRAQVEVKKVSPHPFFWAPYMILDTGSEPPGGQ